MPMDVLQRLSVMAGLVFLAGCASSQSAVLDERPDAGRAAVDQTSTVPATDFASETEPQSEKIAFGDRQDRVLEMLGMPRAIKQVTPGRTAFVYPSDSNVADAISEQIRRYTDPPVSVSSQTGDSMIDPSSYLIIFNNAKVIEVREPI